MSVNNSPSNRLPSRRTGVEGTFAVGTEQDRTDRCCTAHRRVLSLSSRNNTRAEAADIMQALHVMHCSASISYWWMQKSSQAMQRSRHYLTCESDWAQPSRIFVPSFTERLKKPLCPVQSLVIR